jgi:hypothetical protein
VRKFTWMAGLLLALGMAGSAHAQVITFGPIVGQITNSAVDYRNVNAPIGAGIARPSGFKLNQLFHQTTSISNYTPTGTSTFPTPSQMQAAAPSFFKPFQLYRAQRISP